MFSRIYDYKIDGAKVMENKIIIQLLHLTISYNQEKTQIARVCKLS